ncbi:PQQ-binding-like beta-propeller repeat protein [Haloglomus litoreum]|uniref:outer membrane protein assembly factor BamB family protein n=1 Tax=Haloglomus litoreum TaxID=3034026 RepID=UPI0023E7D44B|nr:PQQ-binding-like beta-propeller repeat protein [Haloglomus sp. DT116]
MPSRRTLLAGAAGLVAGGGLVADRVRLGELDAWTPDVDTWPLPRYDLANTASVPDVSVPEDPAVDWTASVEPPSHALLQSLVVGSDRVYAGAGSLAAVDRTDGSRVWEDETPVRALSRRGGRLFAAGGTDETASVTAYDAATGERAWARDLPASPVGLTVAAGMVLTATRIGSVAREQGTGIRRWGGEAPDLQTQPLVHDGALFGHDGYELARFRSRSVLDVPLRAPPAAEWRTVAQGGRVSAPVGVGSRVLVPVQQRGFQTDAGAPALRAVGATTGEVAWRAVTTDDRDTFLTTQHAAVDAARNRAYAGVYRQWVGEPTSGEGFRATVRAFALEDGTVAWTHEAGTGRFVRDVVFAGGRVLVATARNEGATGGRAGDVRALDPADGRERWRVGFDAPVGALAPVDGTVFALTGTGTVAALR